MPHMLRPCRRRLRRERECARRKKILQSHVNLQLTGRPATLDAPAFPQLLMLMALMRFGLRGLCIHRFHVMLGMVLSGHVLAATAFLALGLHFLAAIVLGRRSGLGMGDGGNPFVSTVVKLEDRLRGVLETSVVLSHFEGTG